MNIPIEPDPPKRRDVVMQKLRHQYSRLGRHPYLIMTGVVALGLVVVGIAILSQFHSRASDFDLAKLDQWGSSAEVVAEDGSELGHLYAKNRDYVAYEELPGNLIDAVVATEDSRFFEHNGYDLKGIVRAFVVNLTSGEIEQGGSTITQQLARQTYALRGRTYSRKLTEIFLARRIEGELTKEEILECYLNRIYFGNSYYGVGAASEGYFGKEVADLDVEEAALLSGIIKRPTDYSPFVNPDIALTIRNQSLHRMADCGFITEAEAMSKSGTKLGVIAPEDRDSQPRYALNMARAEAAKYLDTAEGEEMAVQTSIDVPLQLAAQRILQQGLTRIENMEGYSHRTYADYREARKQGEGGSPDYLQGAILVLENRTGRILAAVGGRDYGDSQYNRAFLAHRPPGSAFTPFVYAAGFSQEGISPMSETIDAPMNNRQVMVGGTSGVLGEWGAENPNNSYQGNMPAAFSLMQNKNAATVRFGSEVGLAPVRDLVRKAGVESTLQDYPLTYLGESPVTLAELVRAYSMFPNLGWATEEPHIVTRVTDAKGRAVYEAPEPKDKRVVDPIVAAQTTAILQATLRNGTASEAAQQYGISPVTVAGKTGTAYDFTDCWFVGYNSKVTVGVWIGFDQPKRIMDNGFSRRLALPIWAELMSKVPSTEMFTLPYNAEEVLVCMETGKASVTSCSHTLRIPFSQEEAAEMEPCTQHSVIARQFQQNRKAITVASEPNPTAASMQPIPVKSPVLVGADPYDTPQ